MRTYANGATFDDYEKARKLVHWGVDAIAGALAAERNTDDALLASVMRKFLNAENDWVDYARRDERWRGPAWMTIDVRRIELTDEEYAAVERAGQP